MPVTSPPAVVIPDPTRIPQRDGSQTQGVYSNNADYYATAYPESLGDYVDLATWTQGAANQTETWANAASASATASAGSATSAATAKTNAEAAAAAAQVAAGLTPDPNFGMVIATTASTVVRTAAYTAAVGVMQDVDTTSGGFAITTPATPSVGQWFGVRDYNQGKFRTGFPWVDYASDKIIGLSEDCFINVNTVIFTWRGATKGWCL